MARRPHGKPRQPIRIVVAIFKSIEGPFEPFTRFWKLRGEFSDDFVAHFVATPADSRPERGDDVLRARAKFHLHPTKSFFSDALRRSAPARMNRGDGAMFRIGEQNRNAIGRLHHQQRPRFASDERVALGGAFAVRDLRWANSVNNIRMNLAQAYDWHLRGAE